MIRYCDNHQNIDILELNLVYLFEGHGEKLAKSDGLSKWPDAGAFTCHAGQYAGNTK